MTTYQQHKERLEAVAELVKSLRSRSTDSDGNQCPDWFLVRVPCVQLRMAADEIDRLNAALVQARRDMNEEIRVAGRDARDAIAEAVHRERTGEEYGSY